MPKTKKPHFISPMLSTLIEAPFDDTEWIFEIKLDGYRALCEVDHGKVNLYSRNFNSFNSTFPNIVQELKCLKISAIFDGEIVALDKKGFPNFQLMQNIQNRPETPLCYYVFDLLFLEGKDLRTLPLIERKKLLKQVLKLFSSPWIQYLDHIEKQGIDFFKSATSHHLEGIIGKKKSSSYETGRRSQEWVKIKTYHRQEAIICGFTLPKAGRNHLGALILGVHREGKLSYIGHVGGGFTDQELKEIKDLLKPYQQKHSPFEIPPHTNTPVTWVEPHFLCEVKFNEWTQEGILRQPIFMGLRQDKAPKQVVKEEIKKRMVLTHLEKIYYPDLSLTKGDVIKYYESISEYILPYLKYHPQSLRRYPEGILGTSFFQKNLKNHPSWIETVEIPHQDKVVHYLLIQDVESLVYAVNLGCIELHPFFSQVSALDFPDFLVFDLDPVEIDFEHVILTALILHDTLDALNVPNLCKTSGGRGLHVCVPLQRKYTFEQAKNFSLLIAHRVHEQIPKVTSLERSPKERRNKVYIDCFQNNPGQTIVAPYSLRARKGAHVSMPLAWKEVKEGLDPSLFNYATALQRVKKKGDLFQPLLKDTSSLENALLLLDQAYVN